MQELNELDVAAEQAKTQEQIDAYLQNEPSMEQLKARALIIAEKRKQRILDRGEVSEIKLIRKQIKPLAEWNYKAVLPPPEIEITYNQMARAVWKSYVESLAVEGKKPTIHDHQKRILRNLILYFIGDSSGDYDLRKGIYLFGDYGRGKSFLMRIIKRIIEVELSDKSQNVTNLRGFKFDTYENILDKVKEKGSTHIIRKWASTSMCLDDLGYMEESKINLFGNKSDFVGKIIKTFHHNWETKGIIHHFTSNIGPTKLGALHSEGSRSRVVQMCNIIQWKGGINFREI